MLFPEKNTFNSFGENQITIKTSLSNGSFSTPGYNGEYQSSFCCEYEDLRFDGKTPAQFLKHMDAMADAASDNGYVYGKGRGYDDEDSRSIEVKEGYGQGHDKGYGKGYGYKG